MKKIITLLILFTSAAVFADYNETTCKDTTGSKVVKGQLVIDTNVPKYLRGATITVKLADGKETTVPAEKFKVVPRKQQYLTTDTTVTNRTDCTLTKHEQELILRRNRVSALGGRGIQHGVETTLSTPTEVDVSSKTGFVGGLQYQRLLPVLHDRLSIGVQGQTNRTGSLLLGIDF